MFNTPGHSTAKNLQNFFQDVASTEKKQGSMKDYFSVDRRTHQERHEDQKSKEKGSAVKRIDLQKKEIHFAEKWKLDIATGPPGRKLGRRSVHTHWMDSIFDVYYKIGRGHLHPDEIFVEPCAMPYWWGQEYSVTAYLTGTWTKKLALLMQETEEKELAQAAKKKRKLEARQQEEMAAKRLKMLDNRKEGHQIVPVLDNPTEIQDVSSPSSDAASPTVVQVEEKPKVHRGVGYTQAVKDLYWSIENQLNIGRFRTVQVVRQILPAMFGRYKLQREKAKE